MKVELNNLWRGHHSVQASVVDNAGNALVETKPVSFFMLRVAGGQCANLVTHMICHSLKRVRAEIQSGDI